MNIRDYQPADYEAIIRNLQTADMYDETWDSRDNFASLIAEHASNILVAEADGKVVGSVLIDQFGTKAAFIYRLVVDEAYRGQGIGGQILEAVYRTLRARGAQEVALFADAQDPELIRYYQRRGYAEGKHAYKTMWRQI